MMALILKFVIAVLSLPIAVGASLAFYKNFLLIKELSVNMSYFIWGAVAYVALHILFYKPTFLYVLGHEAVHAGFSWLFGGKIKGFKVSSEGGSVATDKTNAVIELGPYFIPIYAIIVTLIYFLVASSYAINGAVFVFLIGFTLMLHLVSTIEVMKIRQPDFMKSGYLFSIVLVYVLNIIVIAVIFSILFPSFSLKKFFPDLLASSRDIYMAVIRQLFL